MGSKQTPKTQLFLEQDHNHLHCVQTALAKATAICQGRGVRLTALRRRVLEIVWQNHRPLGAYSILDALKEDGRSAAPPTVYRALEFLLEQGLVHRLASLNAFIGCNEPGHVSGCQFLLCRTCGVVAELKDSEVEHAIIRSAVVQGFRVQHHVIEVTGLCPDCQRE